MLRRKRDLGCARKNRVVQRDRFPPMCCPRQCLYHLPFVLQVPTSICVWRGGSTATDPNLPRPKAGRTMVAWTAPDGNLLRAPFDAPRHPTSCFFSIRGPGTSRQLPCSEDAEIRTTWGSGGALVFGPFLRSKSGSLFVAEARRGQKSPFAPLSAFLMVAR